MARLTERQRQVFDLIGSHIRDSGFPPTRAEIAALLGFRSVNAAEDHLQALAKKGAIELLPGASRGIRVLVAMESDDAAFDGKTSRGLNLPLIGRVAAGSPILAAEHIQASYACDPALFTAKPDYLLKVRGMSMRDAGILDGDLLAVQRASEARIGQIVVARLADEVTVKRYGKRGNTIELLPENPDYQPIQVNADDESFAIEGLAVGLIRVGVH
ncbi:transcriptional repressor LexA [Derxia gummosa]|uniref:LexA repressor n=1 Tax=Derxia gummosa DSM 723 TaxID=1121388 RepID=A0A8B6X317_9BURK|nr:transcriptional repressor LexA [Derxia gummosa]